jgi:hypothetical protein
MLNRPDNADINLERTRARLAAVEAQLAADPDNEALRAQRFRLANVIECAEGLALLRQRAAWGRMVLAAWGRRN